jgi:Arc/MetJ-type ribon-helix-helix transcriptional regulator
MSKRRITLTLDEDVVEALRTVGGDSMSAVANDALREALERRAHQAAVLEWLEEQYGTHGRPSESDYAAADAVLGQFGDRAADGAA